MASILEKLKSLRIEEREIIALCDWANLSYAEAATALAIPIGTVRSRLSRAHEHLRDLVGDDPNPDQRVIRTSMVDSPEETDGPS
jgi:DNA-directed RNA polymerase specialized sigma24 family protein